MYLEAGGRVGSNVEEDLGRARNGTFSYVNVNSPRIRLCTSPTQEPRNRGTNRCHHVTSRP